ncbi:hypothetical protein [Streptomyces sp. NPDC003077]|uniref:hypothetical protein n=1 Tax=Streptomyces sp. NPDC003077 TaxID=3154443 RepID=UPI0033A01DDA
MVTARSSFGTPRTRLTAGPLRLLWLAFLLTGIMLSHGMSAENAEGHVLTGTTAAALASSPDTSATDAEWPDRTGPENSPSDGDDFSHTGEECVSGLPQQGSVLGAPCLAPVAGDTAPPAGLPGPFPGDRRAGADTPWTDAKSSIVQQV